jgi:hypothetical protein
MSDPRIILCNELYLEGIPKTLAYMISLEAGSSQALVGRDYIKGLNLSPKFEEIIFQKVSRFYLGYFNDENN